MAHCKYCSETDENKLVMSSRLVNGRAETIDICLACLWRDKFVQKDGRILSEELRERSDKRIGSARGIDPLSLQD